MWNDGRVPLSLTPILLAVKGSMAPSAVFRSVLGACILGLALLFLPNAAHAGDAVAVPLPPAATVTVLPAPPPLALPLAAKPEAERYFYHGYDYGSEAVFNPAYVLVNRGWDMMQLGDDRNDPWRFDYRTNGDNVLDNLGHAPGRVGAEGWHRFLVQEIFPLSFGEETARWVPNYTLHLLGGGMTYAMLDEWFEAHDVPLPKIWSGLTLMLAALANETIENGGITGRNTDCIADVWVFDLGGIFLFSMPAVRRFFSRQVIIADWSTPPVITFPRGEIHNQGNYYAAKWALPFYHQLSLFSYFGAWTTFGLSQKIDAEHSISVSYGVATTKLIGTSKNLVENVVSLIPAAAIFYDRNGSLLASAKVADLPDFFLHLQAYPGLVPAVKWLGAFAQFSKTGNITAGLTTNFGFGLGVRTGSMQ